MKVFAEKIRLIAGGRAGLSSRVPNEAGGRRMVIQEVLLPLSYTSFGG